MKRFFALATIFSLVTTSCDPTNSPPAGTFEKLHGNWYGVEITNHLINQGVWDTLSAHSISMMTLTIDTLNGTVIIDSSGTTLDTAQLIVNSDSSLTTIGNVSNLGWAFDAGMINAFGQPILDSLRTLFTGEQRFDVLQLTEDEAQFYFDTTVTIQYGGFNATMELRHTETWQK